MRHYILVEFDVDGQPGIVEDVIENVIDVIENVIDVIENVIDVANNTGCKSVKVARLETLVAALPRFNSVLYDASAWMNETNGNEIAYDAVDAFVDELTAAFPQ